MNKNYSELMCGDNQRNENNNNNIQDNRVEQAKIIADEFIHSKDQKTNFSINAKPFITKEQIKLMSYSKPTLSAQQQSTSLIQNIPFNTGLLFQNLQSQLRLQAPQTIANQTLNTVNSILINNLEKTWQASQSIQQQQPILPPTNLNDLTLAAFACLPSSLQQFYLQLTTTLSQNSKNQEASIFDLQHHQQHKSLNNINLQTQILSLKNPKESLVSAQNLGVIESEVKTTEAEQHSIILRNPKSKYPLEYEWSFWFFKTNRELDWKDNIVLLTTVNNVEDFWSVYRYLRPVSDLHEGCDYMFFKKGIQPMWEDESNRDGGRWLISFDRDKRFAFLDTFWKLTLLSLIGSQYDKEFELVNGTVINVRYKIDKLSLWTKNYLNQKAQLAIGKRFQRILGVNDGSLIYEIHDTNHQQQAHNFDLNSETNKN